MLNDDEVREIANIAIRSEKHAGCPQDTEWAIAGGRPTSCRPAHHHPCVTCRTSRRRNPRGSVQGLPAVPGAASGVVGVLANVKDGARPGR